MANWDLSYNAPGDDEYYYAYVVRPANHKRGSKTGSGSSGDPFILNYISGGTAAANPRDPWQLNKRQDDYDFRNVTIKVYVNGSERKKDTPTMQDTPGSGPRPRSKSGGGGRSASTKAPVKGRVRRK